MIVNHLIDPKRFPYKVLNAPTPDRGGVLLPRFIVMHYTAGWTASSAVDTLIDGKDGKKVSAHVVVDTDGTVYQLAPFNVVTFHAGPSVYKGNNGLNNAAIGIEIVNPGFLKKIGDNIFVDAYGSKRVIPNWKDELLEAKHARVGSGVYYWPLYTSRQLDAVEKLTKALISTYTILDIVSHEEIDTRGWKTDPGPAFPMSRFKDLLPDTADSFKYRVTSSTLNVRGGPGTAYKILKEIKQGIVVEISDITGEWGKLENEDGYINLKFAKQVG